MSDVVLLLMVVLAWVVLAYWGKRHGWGAGKRHGFGALAAFVVMVVGANVLHPSAENAPTTAATAETQAPSAVVEPPKAPEKDLGLTLDEYVRQFNEVSKMLGKDVHVAVPEIGEGPVNDGANLHISPACGVVISLVKGTRQVRSIIFVGRPDDTTDSFTLIALSGAAVHAAFPEAERKAAGAALGKLLPKLEMDHDPVKTTVGGNEIMASMSKITGFMVAVSPVE